MVSEEVWTLLLVDGDARARGELRRLLVGDGRRTATIVEADTGAEALRRCADFTGRNATCVLVARALPDMDALGVLAGLRGAACDVPVIVIVDAAGDARAGGRAAVRAGATDFVARSELAAGPLWAAIEKAGDRCELARRPGRATATVLVRVADALPQLVWIADATGAVEYFNSRIDDYAGVGREADGMWRWSTAVHPDDRARTEEAWRKAVAEAAPYVCEHRIRMRDGAYHWHLSRAVLVRSGAALRWFGTVTDVHELKAAEAALRERQGSLGRLFESDLLGIHYRDVQGRVFGANDEFLRAVGRGREDLAAGRVDWGAMTPPEYRARAEAAAAELRERGTHAPLEMELLRADGGRVWLLIGAALFGGNSVVAFCLDITERKRAEAALRVSESRARAAADEAERERRLLDAVLAAAPAGIIVADARGKLLRMNPANERLWGPAPFAGSVDEYDEWKGWWADGSERHGRPIAPEEWAMSRALRGEVCRGDVIEIEPFDAPGTRRTVLNSGAPVRDAAGEVAGAVVAQMDITARVRAEAAVRSSEERLRLVGRATNEVIWDWDLETDRLDWNEAACQQFRCTREDLGSQIEGWYVRIHPEDRERVSEGIHAAIDGDGEGWSDEYRFCRGDGSFAVFLDRGYIARGAGGRAYRMIGSMLDLTERRRAEAALRESEARLRALTDNMSQLAWIADEKGQLFWYNQRWYEYTGSNLEEMRGEGWRAVHHPEHLERVVAKFFGHIATGEAWEDTFPLRGKDGRYRWFLSRAIPIRDEAGRVFQWFGTNTDVTAQREAEEALREADRRKDDFLAMLAHELRNPLAPVRNAVEILRVTGPREPEQTRAREVIERQVTHMARLIDDLLDVSRIARGKIQLRKERCDLLAIVRQTAEDYRASLEARGVALSVSGPGGSLWVEGDRTRLAQMIGNLLHNAGKFTRSGGRVGVRVGLDPRADAAGHTALVTVEDSGLGMEPALLARLFDPFSQADQGLARSEGGLGLGLALVRGLVELHGGTVTARSEGLGRGSTFTLQLPLAQAPERAAGGVAERAPDGLSVVVIDDNQDMAETLQMVLALGGHRVEVAFDGPTGIAAARASRPDVVICDIGLPGGADGYAVARALRSDPGLTSTMLIALTGYGQAEDRRRSGEAGFDAHLVKPPDLKKLEALLAAVRRA
jgi:PAS domain S-box-containing protein